MTQQVRRRGFGRRVSATRRCTVLLCGVVWQTKSTRDTKGLRNSDQRCATGCARHTGRSDTVGAVRGFVSAMRDDGRMILHRRLLLVVLVIAATALSACGSSSSSSTTTASSTTGGVAAARSKCLDATKKIQNATARTTAEHACHQITTDNANVNSALKQAKQACLTAAAKIPIDSLKKSAQTERKKIS